MKSNRQTGIRYSYNQPRTKTVSRQNFSVSNSGLRSSQSNKNNSFSIFSFLENSWSSTVYFQIVSVLVVTIGVLIIFQNYSSTQMDKIKQTTAAIDDTSSKAKLVPIFNTSQFETREKNVANFVKTYEEPKTSETAAGVAETTGSDKSETKTQSAKNTDSSNQK